MRVIKSLTDSELERKIHKLKLCGIDLKVKDKVLTGIRVKDGIKQVALPEGILFVRLIGNENYCETEELTFPNSVRTIQSDRGGLI